MLVTQTPTHKSSGAVWTWACAGACIGCVAALLAFAPARWLAAGLHELSSGHIRLGQTQGTVWAGSAQLALTGSAGSRDAVRLPGRVHWTMRAGWGRIVLQVQAACCTTQALTLSVTPRWKRLHLALQDNQSAWPTALLSGLGTPWNTVQLEGQLLAASKGLSVELTPEHVRLSGELQLDARDLSSQLSSLRPMGSYRVTIEGGEQPSLTLTTLSGSLQLSGQGHFSGNRLRFNGIASAVPEHEAELSNLLNIIGRRDGARTILTAG